MGRREEGGMVLNDKANGLKCYQQKPKVCRCSLIIIICTFFPVSVKLLSNKKINIKSLCVSDSNILPL